MTRNAWKTASTPKAHPFMVSILELAVVVAIHMIWLALTLVMQ